MAQGRKVLVGKCDKLSLNGQESHLLWVVPDLHMCTMACSPSH